MSDSAYAQLRSRVSHLLLIHTFSPVCSLPPTRATLRNTCLSTPTTEIAPRAISFIPTVIRDSQRSSSCDRTIYRINRKSEHEIIDAMCIIYVYIIIEKLLISVAIYIKLSIIICSNFWNYS